MDYSLPLPLLGICVDDVNAVDLVNALNDSTIRLVISESQREVTEADMEHVEDVMT